MRKLILLQSILYAGLFSVDAESQISKSPEITEVAVIKPCCSNLGSFESEKSLKIWLEKQDLQLTDVAVQKKQVLENGKFEKFFFKTMTLTKDDGRPDVIYQLFYSMKY